ncbi:MAG: hypothetical protein MUC52_01910 [Candidatus Omnitrophica bacterium]|jgi:hypothetical protein|nr:hypothetical protein [Candidatus Omnitrophota bacterium]
MKLSRFLTILTSATLLSLIYVWQQTEILSLAYEGQKQYVSFQELLDENSSLRYNLTKNTSVTRMAGRISGKGEFAVPANYCLVKVSVPRKGSQYASKNSRRKETLASRVFGIKRQAEAKTINTAVKSISRD